MKQKLPHYELEYLKKILGVKKKPSQHDKRLWDIVQMHQKHFLKIPGVACICVCNSLSMNAAKGDSDIDLFVITKENRLWSVRILITLYCQLQGIRKTTHTHAEKFCLSFFIDKQGMDFSSIALQHDPYLSLWLQYLRPIINRDHSFENFLKKNSHICDPSVNQYYKKSIDLKEDTAPQGLLTKCGDFCELMLKTLYQKKTQNSFNRLGKPFGVVISKHMLKFHNTDKRKILSQQVSSFAESESSPK